MNLYLIQYKSGEAWVPFYMKCKSIYAVEAWVKKNVRRTGVCITRVDL